MSTWFAIAVLVFSCTVVICLYLPRRRKARALPEFLSISLGVVTCAGEYAILLPAGIDLPVEAHEVFAAQSEQATSVMVAFGWGEQADPAPHQLEKFEVGPVRPGQPAVPRIEVVFKIGQDAHLHLSARDIMHRENLQVTPDVIPMPEPGGKAS